MSEIYTRIENELVSSGKYKEIYNMLETELRNSGWYDNFLQTVQNTMEMTPDSELQFTKLVDSLQDKGIQTVPEEVKIKVLQKISEFLKDVIE